MGSPAVEFIEKVFGDLGGYLHLVTLTKGERSDHVFRYPGDLTSIGEHINEWASSDDIDVYFYPVLTERADEASEITCDPVTSADLGVIHPALVTPRPDLIVQSSPGRFQTYWYKGSNTAPMSINGPIEISVGLRRLPGTYNWRYNRVKSGPWLATEVDPDSLDTCDSVVERLGLTSESFDYLFKLNDRWSLARLCAQLGANSTEVFLVLKAAHSQYGDQCPPLSTLYEDAINAVSANKTPTLLTEDELRTVSIPDGSFVDCYVDWVAARTDSPRQYHIASALMVLSSVLAPHIRFPCTFGELKCNLWFMILADTTRTRKTTAMNYAADLAKSIDPQIVFTTDGGSSEGFIRGLSERDGRGSLFYRDEVAGFLEAATDKKYMSGILQTLTKLYDGGTDRRVLSRQVIEINNPFFLIMCGGIKSKVMELLTEEHIDSGFLPRFLVVCGWTRPEDIRPIGPPVEGSEESRARLVDYLIGLSAKYAPGSALARLRGVSTVTRLTATDCAWARMRRLEADMLGAADRSANPDVLSPLYERCKNSILKVSVLLAAERAYRTACKPVVETHDLLRAINYASVWIESINEVAAGIIDKPSRDEKRRLRIADAIQRERDGIARGVLMQRFRLNKREADDIIDTLVDRGLITKARINSTTVYLAATTEEG